MEEKVLNVSTVYDGRIIKLKRKEVRLPDGSLGVREVVEHPGAVAIVALDDEDYIYLVRQYRSPMEKSILEIPAGKLEKNEEPAVCAVRELEEEIGRTPGKLVKLGSYYSSPGYSNELIHIFLATELREVQAIKVPGEFLQAEKMPLSTLNEMIERGEVQDGKTILGILLAMKKL